MTHYPQAIFYLVHPLGGNGPHLSIKPQSVIYLLLIILCPAAMKNHYKVKRKLNRNSNIFIQKIHLKMLSVKQGTFCKEGDDLKCPDNSPIHTFTAPPLSQLPIMLW